MIHKLDRILEFVEQNLQDSFDFLPWFYVTCLRTKDKAQQYEYIFRAVQMKQIKRRTKRITVFVGNYQRLEQQEVWGDREQKRAHAAYPVSAAQCLWWLSQGAGVRPPLGHVQSLYGYKLCCESSSWAFILGTHVHTTWTAFFSIWFLSVVFQSNINLNCQQLTDIFG